MTGADLLREGQDILRRAMPELSEAEIRLEARHLLAWVSGRSLSWLTAHGEDRSGEETVDAFRSAIRRRSNREPLAYILGQAGFYGHEFEVGPETLIPRPDTELLVERVSLYLREFSEGRPLYLLEVGTGTGCIPCSLALDHPGLLAVSVDLSEGALRIARRNAARLGVAERIAFLQMDALGGEMPGMCPQRAGLCSTEMRSHLQRAGSHSVEMRSHPQRAGSLPLSVEPDPGASALDPERYDVLVSNPPYIPTGDIAGLMPEVSLHEPRTALDGGVDGLVFYRRLLELADILLRRNGLLAVEIGYDQGEVVPKLFRAAGFETTLHLDAGNNPRVVCGIRR